MSDDFGSYDPSDSEGARARKGVQFLVDMARRTIAQSADAKQVTEDVVKAIVGEMKLPREIGNVVLQQADQIKNEVVRVVGGEVRNFLHEANLGEELAKILTSLSFEVRMEVRFIPNDEALKPNVRSRVAVKSTRDDKEAEFVETKETAAMDRAIRSGVSSLANRIFSRLDEVFEEEGDEASAEDVAPSETTAGSDEAEADRRTIRRPDLRKRAGAVASQAASAGRATASKAAATAVTAAKKPVASVAAKAKASAPAAVAAARQTASAAAARGTAARSSSAARSSTDAASRAPAVVRSSKPERVTEKPKAAETKAPAEKSAKKPATTSPKAAPKTARKTAKTLAAATKKTAAKTTTTAAPKKEASHVEEKPQSKKSTADSDEG